MINNQVFDKTTLRKVTAASDFGLSGLCLLRFLPGGGNQHRRATRDKHGPNMALEPQHHRRNTGPMLVSPRCGARTRSGQPCRAPAVNGKKRCRMHGGAPGSGAPRGNQNALKLGRYTRKAIARRRKQRRREREIIGLLRQLFRGRIQDDGSGKG